MPRKVTTADQFSDWLTAAHQRFAPELSRLLRTEVHTAIVDMQRKTYGEYMLSATLPTCFHVIAVAPERGHFIVETPALVLGQWLDCLLGGGASSSGPAKCPLTEIEQRLIGKIIDPYLNALQTALPDTKAETLSVERMEFGLKEMRVMRPTDDILVAQVALSGDGVDAFLSICVTESLCEQLCTPAAKTETSDPAERTTVELVAQLAETTLSAEELAALAVGDILTTDTDVGQPLTVTLDGAPTFLANLGKVDNKKAIQIVEKTAGERPRRE